MYLTGIETARLRFRKLDMSDAKDWEQFFENNHGLEYLGLDMTLDKKAQSIDWIKRQLTRYKENRSGHHALLDKGSGNFIGQCGLLKQEVEGKSETELGYHILPEYWGKGFATEAASKIRDYTFANKLCNSLISVIDIRNMLSQKVAEKLGMKIDKELHLFGLDVFIYRITLDGYHKNLIDE